MKSLILGLNGQWNYIIGCNWDASDQQYITNNNKFLCTSQQYITHNKFLCTSTVSSNTEPIICNAGILHLPLRSISVIALQAPIELNTQHIYQLNTSDDLPSGLIPQVVTSNRN